MFFFSIPQTGANQFVLFHLANNFIHTLFAVSQEIERNYTVVFIYYRDLFRLSIICISFLTFMYIFLY